MIHITQVKISPDDEIEKAKVIALKKAGLNYSEIENIEITKTSVDGRHGTVQLVYSFAVESNGDEEKIVKKANSKDVQYKKTAETYLIPQIDGKETSRPIIIGFGPAGMFSGLALARAGLKPIIFEQGSTVEKREKEVELFWKTGQLSPSSNVQFGEGGAGTFSDGKLTTRIGDSRCAFILNTFVEFGAPPEIRYQAKPHIGTDQLRKIVKNIREEIIKLGGEIHFNTEVTEFLSNKDRICGVRANGNTIESDSIILAIGHSSRKMFSYLADSDFSLEKKAFSVGTRIEHLQKNIDKALYGDFAGHPALPHGEYQLSHRDKNGRGVYTFCMCPGGYVVASASEEGGVVTNGMSEYSRNAENANSGLVVSVFPEDTPDGILGGIEFQRALEQRAFQMGGGKFVAPAETVGSYLERQETLQSKSVSPSYRPSVKEDSLHDLFPSFVNTRLEEGLRLFDRKLKGFADSDAILTGVESRTSSPIRILRGENFQALKNPGVYPCGEGAGYAGGIMSAAVDGLRVAEAIIAQYCKEI